MIKKEKKNMNSQRKVEAPKKTYKTVEFAFHSPEAMSVCVTGEFNDWNTQSLPMKKDRMEFGGQRSSCFLDAMNTNCLPIMHGLRISLMLKPFPTLLALRTSSFRLSKRFLSIKNSFSKMQGCGLNALRCGFMDVFEARSELRRVGRRYLLGLVLAQRISKCLIGGRACGLYLHHKGFNFCVSEIMGEGCQVERLARTEEFHQRGEKINSWLPLTNRIGTSPFLPGKTEVVEFKVYCKDCVTPSMIFLGNILERRTKERGNNLKDLLTKAVKDYSDCIADPAAIFLVSL